MLSFRGWQDNALSGGKGVTPLGRDPKQPSRTLGIMGMPGFTAWAGLTQIGAPKPGETACVAAATGPMGATVGQIARLMGSHVIGIAGGPDKCAHAVDTLGFDACIDRMAADFAAKLKAAAPKSIDVYFENADGAVFGAVLPILNTAARIRSAG